MSISLVLAKLGFVTVDEHSKSWSEKGILLQILLLPTIYRGGYHTVLRRGAPFLESGALLPPVTRSGKPFGLVPSPTECQFWNTIDMFRWSSFTMHAQ